MEYLEVCDEAGNPTGEVKPRHEVHRDGDWHLTVDVWLFNRHGEVLIQQRSVHKDGNPLKWNSSSAGHVVAGATPLATARQETLEEIGLDVPEDAFTFLFTTKEIFPFPDRLHPARELAHVYAAEIDTPIEACVLQADEVAAVRFVHHEELARLVGDRDESLVPHDEQYQGLFRWLQERFNRSER